MIPAAARLLAFTAVLLATPVGVPATTPRAAPTRPAPLPAIRIRGIDYVNVADAAVRFGLKSSGAAGVRTLTLSDASSRVELEPGSRETAVNGSRVFLGQAVIARSGQVYVSKIDFERALLPMLRPALCGSPPRPPKLIALDPGHGGRDDGTENSRLKLKEKTFTLDVAQRLKRRLEARGFKVVLVRETDTKIELPVRAEIANRAGADVFVSIHFNALPNDAKTKGIEVFTFAPQFQRSTNSWNPDEKDDTEHEPAPGNRHDPWNVVLAQAMHRELLANLKTFDRGKKIAHFGVLRTLECPGVLVECGFLSNDDEARKIATPAYREQIAESLLAGLQTYAETIGGLYGKTK